MTLRPNPSPASRDLTEAGPQPPRRTVRRRGPPDPRRGSAGRRPRDRGLVRARGDARRGRPPRALARPAAALLPRQADGRARSSSWPTGSTRSTRTSRPSASPVSSTRATRAWCRRITSSRSASWAAPIPLPAYRRFFAPERGTLPADLDAIGAAYVGALAEEIRKWVVAPRPREPIGVCFSGGVDSGAVLLVTRARPARPRDEPGAAEGLHARRRRSGGSLAGAAVPRGMRPRLLPRGDRDGPARHRPRRGRARDRGLQAARRRVGGDGDRAVPRHPRAVSRVEVSRGRRRRRREPEGLSDRGEPRAHDPERALEPDALPGGLGRGQREALADVLGRPEPRLHAHLRAARALRLRRVQPFHAAGRHRGRRGDPVRRADGLESRRGSTP